MYQKIQNINKLINKRPVVIAPAPLPPKYLPNMPAAPHPINGKKIINNIIPITL